MKKYSTFFFELFAVLGAIILVWCFFRYVPISKACEVEPQQTVIEQEPAEQLFDVSALESWCGGCCDGTVRMVGAWYDSTNNGWTCVEDETGELWNVTGYGITENDFLLLWIADNHTPSIVEDDIIVKVWVEAHE